MFDPFLQKSFDTLLFPFFLEDTFVNNTAIFSPKVP